MKKRVIAGAMCLSMLCVPGCSLGKGSSSEKAGITFSGTRNGYNINNFSFEMSGDFSVTDEKESNESGVYEYTFTGCGFEEVDVYSYGLEQCTAEVSMQAIQESIKARNDTSVKDIEIETLDVPGFNAASIHMINSRESGETGESYLCLSTEGIQFNTSVIGYAPAERENVKALLNEIAATVKYTGTEYLPTEPQSYENEFFSLSCGPEWYIRDKSKEDSIDVKLSYYYAQDMEHYMSPSLTIHITPEDEENTPKKKADSLYDSKKESKYSSDIERGSEDFLGYNAEKVSFAASIGCVETRYTDYIFSENGYVYTVGAALNMRDEEGSRAELQAILDTLTVKKLDEAEIARRQEEHEASKYQELTFKNAKFTLSSKFDPGREFGNSITYSNSKDGMQLIMTCESYGSDYDEYLNSRGSKIGINYEQTLSGITAQPVILNHSYEAAEVIDKFETEQRGETVKHLIYFLKMGSDAWEFDIEYPEKDKDKAMKYLEDMLWTITFE